MRKRPPDEYLVMLGAVGEYFAYQQLKVVCPDFDVTNWLSKAKEVFGYDAGDDLLGYDFAFNDATGILGRTNIFAAMLDRSEIRGPRRRQFLRDRHQRVGGRSAAPSGSRPRHLHHSSGLGPYLKAAR